QILGSTIVDTDGLTIVHAGQAMRLVTQADLGIAASQALRAGTDSGNVEITAGEVSANDPAFTVVPDMDVPAAPVVDTSGPRQATESAKTVAGALWDALEMVSGIRTWASFIAERRLSSGVAQGTLFATVGGVVDLVRTAFTVVETGHAAAVAAVAAMDLAGVDAHASGAPQVKIHGAGGVTLTSPEAVSLFAEDKVSITARSSASLKAARKVSVKSAGYTALYGALATSVSSEGPATLKSKGGCASLSGVYAEVSGKQVVAVHSGGALLVSGKERLSVESAELAVAAREVSVWGSRAANLAGGDHVHLTAGNEVKLAVGSQPSAESAELRLRAREASLSADQARIELSSDGIKLKPGGGVQVEIKRGETRVGSALRVTSSSTTIRGNVNLG
ncbi:MAG: hypothetical protein K8H88_31275, partial [Sandaracinaceae bacterium]|nr:hypothetical protein [Sandaracinaceae bacterium]